MQSRSAHRPTRAAGFTLVELMVVVAIATILFAIAVPSYITYVRQSRRTEARTAALDLAGREERFFSTNGAAYAGAANQLGYTAFGVAELVRGARIGGPIGAEEALLATREVEGGGSRLGAPGLAHVGDVGGNRDGEENRGDRDHHHQLDQREAGRSGRAVSAARLHGASPGRCGDD